MRGTREAFARASALVVVAGVGCLAAPGCKSGGSKTTAKPTGITRWVHSDLRTANLRDIRLAEARFAEICRGDIQSGIGAPISASIITAANVHVLPDALATHLACALDAPGHTSCDDLKACAGADSAVPADVPVCDSETLIGRTACGPAKDPARCKGSALEICVSGAWWDVSCSSLESGTRCKAAIGYAGEAGCG